jgi:hypothetical protein
LWPAVEQLDEPRGLVGVTRRRTDARDRIVQARRVSECELEWPPGGPQGFVDAGQHPPEGARAIRREQREAFRGAAAAELGQGRLERLAPEHGRLALVQHPEPRVEPSGERMLLQEPEAEAVDGRDPGAVELARQIAPAELGQPSPDTGAQLGRRAFGVRDHEDRADVDAAVDRAGETLDEHGRLAGTGTGGDEDQTLCLDRGVLLGCRRALCGRGHG